MLNQGEGRILPRINNTDFMSPQQAASPMGCLEGHPVLALSQNTASKAPRGTREPPLGGWKPPQDMRTHEPLPPWDDEAPSSLSPLLPGS